MIPDVYRNLILIPLPKEAQVSVLNNMVAVDVDRDGILEVIINGNDYGTEVSTGRYDALNGLVLKGNGKGNFKPCLFCKTEFIYPEIVKPWFNFWIIKVLDDTSQSK
ncbi:MAG: hypothetical protein ABI472_09535 [Ginsengibacter sp.]